MTYSISDLEQLSGVQSHTIRIWEQRYHALSPVRSAGNTRRYDDAQLKRLLNIVSLNKSGHKISKICALSDVEIDALLKSELESMPVSPEYHLFVDQLLKYGLAYDESSFASLLGNCIDKLGMVDVYKHIMYPVLVRLGLMWRKDDICPAQEHFLSNLIRQKIYAAIDRIEVNNGAAQTWLLFLPEDEIHDIGLLFANYLLKSKGMNVIFLGTKVPFDSLSIVLKQNKIDHLLFFLTRSRRKNEMQVYCDALTKITPGASIFLAGNSQVIEQVKLNTNMHWFKTLEEFEDAIQTVTL